MAHAIAVPPSRPRLLTVEQTAVELNVSEATVWRLLRAGDLPRVKVGNVTRVPAHAVDKFITDRTAVR